MLSFKNEGKIKTFSDKLKVYIFLKDPDVMEPPLPNNHLDITQFIAIFSFPVPLLLLLPRIISQVPVDNFLSYQGGTESKTKAFPRTEDTQFKFSSFKPT